jgi:hypothetical protein
LKNIKQNDIQLYRELDVIIFFQIEDADDIKKFNLIKKNNMKNQY